MLHDPKAIGYDVTNTGLRETEWRLLLCLVVALMTVPSALGILHSMYQSIIPDTRHSSNMMIRLCERAHHSGIGEDGFYTPYAALTTRAITLVPDSKLLSYVYVTSLVAYGNRYTIIRRSRSHRRRQN